MLTGLHHLEDLCEQFEVGSLGGSQWVYFEERHHTTDKVIATLHAEAQQDLAMVTWPVLLDDAPAAEDLDEDFECRPRRRGLGDGELVLDLPAEPTPGVSHHRDREASFAVDEADDPLLSTWPFLLIVRTGRIVTIHTPHPTNGV